jgi:protein translocase SecG subunit
MEALVLVVHVLAAVAIIGLVLIQQGKGADAGASFGGGASQTVFGSQGGGSFFGKLTAVFASASVSMNTRRTESLPRERYSSPQNSKPKPSTTGLISSSSCANLVDK